MASVRRKGTLPDNARPVQGSFTGPALQYPLHEHAPSGAIRVSFVGFEAGSRTHWHKHSGGQVLHVVEGRGLTQVEGGAVEEIFEGDTVTVTPGEKHWHGAGANRAMRHLAVTIGEVEWLGPPPPLPSKP